MKNLAIENIEVAEDTNNQIIEWMQGEDRPTTEYGILNVIAMELVGINQALVAIAAALAREE